MPITDTNVPSPSPEWEAFSRRRAGCRFLSLDPLYALTVPILDAIKAEVPQFFTRTEERFERDLIRTASFGFFLRRPLGYRTGASVDRRLERTSRNLQEIRSIEMTKLGVSDHETREQEQRLEKMRDDVETRQCAYVGWLLTNGQYREELGLLRDRWEGAVRDAGRFPTLPTWGSPDPTADIRLPDGCRDEFYGFLCCWCLDTFLTWDWPVPMEPDLAGGMRERVPLLSSAGVQIFLPWFMLRGGKLDLREYAQYARFGTAPDNLWGWVNQRTGRKGEDLGDVRHAVLRWLYRYYELALRRRYPASCRGNVQRLDRALASVIQRDEDTIKKLRQRLRRALGHNDADREPG